MSAQNRTSPNSWISGTPHRQLIVHLGVALPNRAHRQFQDFVGLESQGRNPERSQSLPDAAHAIVAVQGDNVDGKRMPNVCTPDDGAISRPSPGASPECPSSPTRRDKAVSAIRISEPSTVPRVRLATSTCREFCIVFPRAYAIFFLRMTRTPRITTNKIPEITRIRVTVSIVSPFFLLLEL